MGVFYTGEAAGETDPTKWPPTAHVLVAGGIVPTGGEDGARQLQYTATDTVDILREDGFDDVTGEVLHTCSRMFFVAVACGRIGGMNVPRVVKVVMGRYCSLGTWVSAFVRCVFCLF